MNIWKECQGGAHIDSLNTSCFRVVEPQSHSATRVLVSNSEKHVILEDILHEEKPPLILGPHEKICTKYHYLLLTPFRYPPLKHGTRFGARYERGIFYGSQQLKAAMQETAYYRLVFARGTEAKIGDKFINYTSFKANVSTNRGLDLSAGSFNPFKKEISSPISYSASQPLGTEMRNAGVEAFISYSARSATDEKNVNIFTPLALSNNEHLEKTFQHWKCFYTKDSVEFYALNSSASVELICKAEEFTINGNFPFPPD